MVCYPIGIQFEIPIEYVWGKRKKIELTVSQTPKNFFIEEFVALRSKMYAFKCGDVSRNNLKDN